MKKSPETMKLIIESLERTPIIESVCSKMQIARSTLYRWMDDEPEFKEAVQYALESGRDVVSDVAESQLINQVKTGNIGAVKYWLSNNNKRYKKKYLLDSEDASQVDYSPETLKEVLTTMIKHVLETTTYEPTDTEGPPQ